MADTFRYKQGLYQGEVLGFVYGKSQNKGTPMLEVHFRVMNKFDTVNNKLEPCEKQYQRKWTAFITKNNFEVFQSQVNSLLKSAGITTGFSSFDQLNPDSPQCVKLKGKMANFYCSGQNDQGFDQWMPDSGGGKTKELPKNDASVVRDLDSMFGTRLSATSEIQEEQETQEHSQYIPGEDELPF